MRLSSILETIYTYRQGGVETCVGTDTTPFSMAAVFPIVFPALFAAALALGSTGCERMTVEGDFSRPYEHSGLLLPATTHFYTITGPRGLSVDIALDYDAFEETSKPVQLVVLSPDARQHVGVKVPGSGLPQAVCGISLEPRAGVVVKVQNLKLVRSLPFALRIERSPSPICAPYIKAPSMMLVELWGGGSYWTSKPTM